MMTAPNKYLSPDVIPVIPANYLQELLALRLADNLIPNPNF